MTRRDLTWRGVGLAVAMLGVAIVAGGATAWGLPAFCLVLLGVVLIVQGKRVPAALRIERSRHRALAQAIRDRRRQRPGQGSGDTRP